MSEPSLDVHQLRRRWKPHKERLLALRQDHPTPIRFHRACSWLSRVESMGPEDVDLQLIAQWIALNALYGQWDLQIGSAVADRECWRVFLDRIIDLDCDQRVSAVLQSFRPQVMAVLEDPYLSGLFWQDPSERQAGRAKVTKFRAQTWYFERNWKQISESVVDRIYLLRCQLMRGASTYGGKLNRQPVQRCSFLLGHLLCAILLVLIDHGPDEDWGIMCYPPVDSKVPGTSHLRYS